MLAVPAAKLFTRESNKAIGRAIKNSKPVLIDKKLREEIKHWQFLDTWVGNVPWRAEHHLQVSLATDASSYRWAAFVSEEEVIRDFFKEDDSRPIHLKEGEALLKTLISLDNCLANHRVDAFVDNQALVA